MGGGFGVGKPNECTNPVDDDSTMPVLVKLNSWEYWFVASPNTGVALLLPGAEDGEVDG